MLEKLNLAHNALSGSIPATLSNLSNIKILMLNANKLSGGIPLLGFKKVTHLSLNGNSFNGSFPLFFSRFKRMRRLTLDDGFSGTLLDQVGDAKLCKDIGFEGVLIYDAIKY